MSLKLSIAIATLVLLLLTYIVERFVRAHKLKVEAEATKRRIINTERLIISRLTLLDSLTLIAEMPVELRKQLKDQLYFQPQKLDQQEFIIAVSNALNQVKSKTTVYIKNQQLITMLLQALSQQRAHLQAVYQDTQKLSRVLRGLISKYVNVDCKFQQVDQ